MAGWWVLLLLLAATAARAESDGQDADPMTDDRVAVRTEGSHQLLLPADWPVEQKDGRFAPAPMEEYLSMKFGQVRTRFGQTDARAAAAERRLEALERQQRELLKGFKALEERVAQQEGNHGDQAQGGEAAGEGAPQQ